MSNANPEAKIIVPPPKQLEIPRGRTQKQPVRFACLNDTCQVEGQRLEFESDKAVCPKCGATSSPPLFVVALIHLLVLDEKGPIRGSSGRRWRIACDKERSFLATTDNHEQGTNMLDHCTCPGCLEEARKLQVPGWDTIRTD